MFVIYFQGEMRLAAFNGQGEQPCFLFGASPCLAAGHLLAKGNGAALSNKAQSVVVQVLFAV
jgi:hypothetical protein